jgi:hypothetical protein
VHETKRGKKHYKHFKETVIYPSAQQIADFSAKLISERPAIQGPASGRRAVEFEVPRKPTVTESLDSLRDKLKELTEIPSDVHFHAPHDWGHSLGGCALGRFQDVVVRAWIERDIINDKLLCRVDCIWG